jgi:hypothetical protein
VKYFTRDTELYLHIMAILKVDVTPTEYAGVIVFYSGTNLYAAGTKRVTLKGDLATVEIGIDADFSNIILSNLLGYFQEIKVYLV